MQLARKIFAILDARERRGALVVLLLMLLGVVLETFSVGLVIPALSLMTQPDGHAASGMAHYLPAFLAGLPRVDLVLWGMVALTVIYAVKAAFLVLVNGWQTRFAFDVQKRVSRQLLATYLSQPYTFHLQRNSAQLIFNITTSINLFASSILHSLAFASEMLVILALGGLLVSVEPLGSAVVAVSLGGMAVLMHRMSSRHNVRWGKAYQFHEGMRIQHIQQGLGGVKDIILLGRANSFVDRYALHNSESARMSTYQAILQNVPRLALEAFAVAGLALLVFLMIEQGKDLGAIVPAIGLFAAAAFRLMPSLNRILLALQTLKYQKSAVETIHAELVSVSLPARLALPEPGGQVLALARCIAVEDVVFHYPERDTAALSSVSLRIAKGTSIGLIGTSGSGKSTLVDVLLGLLSPSQGRVSVDGVPISEDLRGWQQQIGYVPQNIFLTDESLRANIALGIPDAEIDEESVRRAVEAAQLEALIASLPEGLDTPVGERGVRLSGGQRQRIGIARALYHDPQVLVLDEATSALDADTEAEVMQAIHALHGEKTIVIIAHRMSTVMQCDCLYRLAGGRIVEQGPPDALLSSPAGQAD